MKNIKQDVLDELQAVLGREPKPNEALQDLGFDSLDAVEFAMDMEERLCIPMDERAFTAARTVQDLVDAVDRCANP